MSKSEELIKNHVDVQPGSVMIWPYKTAPEYFQTFIGPLKEKEIECFVLVDDDIAEEVSDWLGDFLYKGYIDPESYPLGNYTLYILFN